jgi:hypothetical protein
LIRLVVILHFIIPPVTAPWKSIRRTERHVAFRLVNSRTPSREALKHPRSSLPLEANTQIAQVQFAELSEDRESLIAVLLPKE